MYAFAGDVAVFRPLIKWWEAGYHVRSLPVAPSNYKIEGLFWIFEGGKLLEINLELPYPIEIYAPAAIGTGTRWATGALKMKATPAQAVRVAMECDTLSGGAVVEIELPPHLQLASAEAKSPAKIAMPGRSRGGIIRAAKLSPERRTEIAQSAANKRWKKA